MNKDEAMRWATEAEQICFEPELWRVDGSPYTCDPTDPLFWEAIAFLGNGDCVEGILYIENKIRSRREDGEPRANHECGNWMIWQVFIELKIPCQADYFYKS